MIVRVLFWIVSCGIGANAFAGDWPAFRGPQGDGSSTAKHVPTKWSADENVRWKRALPQPGNGSAIVVGERVFVTSAEDPQGKQRSLFCVGLNDGQERWKQTVDFGKVLPTHQTNPYAGTTPACDGDRIVAWHASAGLHCYDLDGKPLWNRDFGEFKHIWGYGSSPIFHHGRVILHSGPGQKIFVAALNRDTGETLWQHDDPVEGDGSNTPDKRYFGSWTTPVVTTVNGRDQLLVTLPTRVVALDPDTGKLVWWCDGLRHGGGDLAYSSPIVVGDVVFQTGGFNGPAFAVRLGGNGDVSSQRLWRTEKHPQSIGTGVAVGNVVYRPNAGPGTIECIDPLTGQIVWRDRASGNNHWASIVVAEGRAYATDQAGTTLVFRPNPAKYDELSQNTLGDETNATPAVVDNTLIFRGMKQLICIGK